MFTFAEISKITYRRKIYSVNDKTRKLKRIIKITEISRVVIPFVYMEYT